ncbi:hypothetical protein LTR10_014763 [Elasticomyces elasticus]|uniref:Uncharacterized protein n=1 Tax=Exophiala sideris TaxID=1016849 RepID=A0ABR0J7Q3_9EURO|nr:hypothetical protein LTR10_014763 [Elasticomyces elasticus]KAK5029408.1 hypothetical protein LTS07_005870 [Exophiala sideris]KAK5036894.1 hypothetical protein LTR13_005274 [Exophiala sideris]KAK5058038.1 hypothetical protein LTR69_007035 [Exophiala sideris]KAK5181997.1 hypothetical protein LTR44_005598 [Eurotiomycetes sp. CCFEE 6388]
MARPATDIKRYTTLSITRKCHRHIPLTAYTLLTVPEGSMLSVFEKSDTVDMGHRLMELSMETEPKDSVSGSEPRGRGACESAITQYDAALDNEEDTNSSSTQDQQLEMDLDKFMGAITAYCSPQDVIKTIAASKGSISRTGTGC